jgi:hypothetical protein
MAEEQSPRVQIMGLWKAQGRNGEYLRGKLGTAMVWVFPNDRKQPGENTPDYRVFISEDRPNPNKAQGARGSGYTYSAPVEAPAQGRTAQQSALAGDDDFLTNGKGGGGDDIPF